MSSDGLVHLRRPAAGDPAGALVLFHGRGTSERDLVPLLEVLDPEHRLLGVTPRGPLSLPPGGAHWYAVARIGFPDHDTFHATYAAVSGWLDALLADEGIPIERTILGGFSQGAVMSYALGLGTGRPQPAGIIALSGFIPTVDGFELDLERRAGLPVAIGHGIHDPVIGVEWGRDARERLEAAGAALTYREYPLPHSVEPGFLEELGGEWVPAVLERAG
ncbi:MAG: phospholipase/carboxylesterase [Thermoleophilaceae bacterium]|nr:phospholipase/carboxylesterase [Thermoleophilaceae bacterium]